MWAKLTAVTDSIVDVAAAARGAGAEAVTLVNTLLGMAIDVERRAYALGSGPGGGGLSGPAIHPVAVRAVHDVHAALPDLPIVGVGGVSTGADAVELLLAGASAVASAPPPSPTPGPAGAIQDELVRWCEDHDIAHDRRADRSHPCLTPTPPTAARDRLALVLDIDDLVAAMRLAKAVQPQFGIAKVGLELCSAAGPDALAALTELGYDVFVDLKLHDIPTTVRPRRPACWARRVPGGSTPTPLGGTDMLRAGVEGLQEGADDAGLEQPLALAVTVLTSEHDAPPSLLAERAGLAAAAGCGGVVCAVAGPGDHPPRRALAAVRHARHPPRRQRRRRPGAGRRRRPRPSTRAATCW